MMKASEFSEGQDEEEDEARTGESDPGFKIASMIYQRIIYMHPMLHKLEANNGNGIMKPLNISKSSICSINRNPADFNMPEVGNGRHGLVKVDQHKWRRNMKALYQKGDVYQKENVTETLLIEFEEGKFFQEKAREVDEESNEMILRTRNVETQGEIVLNLHGKFFQEKTSEVDKESNEMILRTRNVETQGEIVREADKDSNEMTLKTRWNRYQCNYNDMGDGRIS
ncbi:silencing defective 5, partial [Prunus dulcis]